MDDDHFTDDLVDRYERRIAVIPSSWASPVKWRQVILGGNPSTTVLQYSVQCNQDYYGPSCTTHCVERNDDTAGHYTCDKTTGHIICRVGWHGSSCKVYCTPHDDSIHGHTRVSLVQEERSVYMAGMALVAKCIVCLEMTLWRVTLAIRKDERFVCKIGSEKITAI